MDKFSRLIIGALAGAVIGVALYRTITAIMEPRPEVESFLAPKRGRKIIPFPLSRPRRA
ncbi:MAG: hypothetical protein ABSG42_09565 [Nitrospirota bacterium]